MRETEDGTPPRRRRSPCATAHRPGRATPAKRSRRAIRGGSERATRKVLHRSPRPRRCAVLSVGRRTRAVRRCYADRPPCKERATQLAKRWCRLECARRWAARRARQEIETHPRTRRGGARRALRGWRAGGARCARGLGDPRRSLGGRARRALGRTAPRAGSAALAPCPGAAAPASRDAVVTRRRAGTRRSARPRLRNGAHPHLGGPRPAPHPKSDEKPSPIRTRP